ncbi:MAG: hypothetical protein V4668_00650 [Patescibacteria group bacterium]
MANIPSLSLPLDLITNVIFLVAVIIYVIFTIVFYYHWQNYSVDKSATIQTYLAYFVITLPLLALMGLSVLII